MFKKAVMAGLIVLTGSFAMANTAVGVVAEKSEALEIIEEQVLRMEEHLDVLHTVALEQGDVETMKDINNLMKQAQNIKSMTNVDDADVAKNKLSLDMLSIEVFLTEFQGK